MSMQSEEESTSDLTTEEKPPSKIFYCEKERALKAQRDRVIYEEPQPVKTPLPIKIKSLKDYVNDPERPEPLIGLEYVIEIRYKGRKEPSYECQLCEFNTEMVPMIEHLTGQRHRRTYLTRHYPDKGKRYPNEDKALFLKRVARLVEKEEGLKKYKCEFYERPCVPSAAAKKKGKGLFKHQNNPVRKRNALKFMNTFEVTSDTEATLVINIAQTLSDSLKSFCERRAAIAHIRTLPPLMQPGRNHSDQASEYKPTNQASECEPANQASKYEPTKTFANCKQGDKNSWNLGDKKWNLGRLSNGIAQLKALLQQTSSISHTPTDSHGSQMGRRVSSSVLSSKDRATMSALQSSFALQPGDVGCGINEWMKQFNQSASVYCQSASAGEKSPCFTSPQGSYPTQRHQGNGTKVPNNRMAGGKIRPWDNMRDSPDSRGTYSLAPVSYPLPRGYQAKYPSQGFPSWNSDRSMSSNQLSASFPSEKNSTGWPQQSGYQQSNFSGDVGSYPSFSGNRSCSNYQQQNTQLDNLISGSNGGLTDDIMNQLRGKDVATLTGMLQQLVPHYPDLQKINIHALARAVSEMR
ncbi:uncharacterized protein [Tiliqua scincoides]|uniref:uncharacterized protein isoform X2 n=1 Tax=Tiliqua scincoides TaxID=71010 RepID=UPI003461D409